MPARLHAQAPDRRSKAKRGGGALVATLPRPAVDTRLGGPPTTTVFLLTPETLCCARPPHSGACVAACLQWPARLAPLQELNPRRWPRQGRALSSRWSSRLHAACISLLARLLHRCCQGCRLAQTWAGCGARMLGMTPVPAAMQGCTSAARPSGQPGRAVGRRDPVRPAGQCRGRGAERSSSYAAQPSCSPAQRRQGAHRRRRRRHSGSRRRRRRRSGRTRRHRLRRRRSQNCGRACAQEQAQCLHGVHCCKCGLQRDGQAWWEHSSSCPGHRVVQL